jgi:RNA polymerase sigma-70 factor (ECF subfamily)
VSVFNQTIDEITYKSACKKNSNAQKKIYELFASPVYNLIYRMVQNRHDALDVSQDVFVKVFTRINQSQSVESLGFWIRKICINTTLSFIKKNSHLITNVDFKEKQIHRDTHETMSSLEFALNKIPTIPRSVLWLYEVEGLNHQEIADLFGKSISFSKTNLSRAKQLAQMYLTQNGGGYEAVQ